MLCKIVFGGERGSGDDDDLFFRKDSMKVNIDKIRQYESSKKKKTTKKKNKTKQKNIISYLLLSSQQAFIAM